MRYITFNVEIYSSRAANADPADFPYCRVAFVKDRAGNTITNGSSKLPQNNLEKFNTSEFIVLSDNTFPIGGTYDNAS